MTNPSDSRLRLWPGATLASLFVTVVSLLHFDYTPDDAYIYFQYAKNILRGDGISFNAGDPSYGVTGPLWMFLSSMSGLLFPAIPVATKTLDILFAAGSVFLFVHLVRLYTGEATVVWLSTTVLVAHAWFLRWAGSGMETSAAIFFMLLSFSLLTLRRHVWASLACGALMLLRPEGGLLMGLIAADLLMGGGSWRRRFIRGVYCSVAFSTVTLPWTLFAWRQFGTIVPNTARGKAGFQFTLQEQADTAMDIAKTLGATDLFLLVIIAWAGYSAVAGRWKTGKSSAGNNEWSRPFFLALGWTILVLLYYVASGTNVVSRYLLLVSPVLIPQAVTAVWWRLHARLDAGRARGFAFLIVAIIVGQNQIFYHGVVRPGISEFQRGMDSSLVKIGLWLKENSNPGDRVIIGDIGAVGYYSDRRICDAGGLITPEALDYLHDSYHSYDIIRERVFENFCDVEYVVHEADRPNQLVSQPDLNPRASFPFRGMTLTDSTTHWYTIYHVERNE